MSRKKLKLQKLAHFPQPYRDTLAYWSALREMGFEAEEIFFGFDRVDHQPDCLHLQLQTQGKIFTVVTAVALGANREHVTHMWQRFCKIVQRSTQPERQACCHAHQLDKTPGFYAAFVAAIRGKGIVIPEMPELSQHAGSA